MQNNDYSQIGFLRQTMTQCSYVLSALGQVFMAQSSTIADAAQVISPETDLKIFIEHNKSDNCFV